MDSRTYQLSPDEIAALQAEVTLLSEGKLVGGKGDYSYLTRYQQFADLQPSEIKDLNPAHYRSETQPKLDSQFPAESFERKQFNIIYSSRTKAKKQQSAYLEHQYLGEKWETLSKTLLALNQAMYLELLRIILAKGQPNSNQPQLTTHVLLATNEYALALANELEKILAEMSHYKELIEEDNQAYVKLSTLKRYDDFYDPVFQVFISAYGLLKNLWDSLKSFSYVPFSLGDVLNFVSVYEIKRDKNKPGSPGAKTKFLRKINTGSNVIASVINTILVLCQVNPYFLAISAFVTILINLIKDGYSLKTYREAVAEEKKLGEKLAQKRQRLATLQFNDLDTNDKICSTTLQLDINYHEKKLANLRNERFKNKRAVFFTTLNTVFSLILLLAALSIATPLFPAAITLPSSITELLAKWSTDIATLYTMMALFDIIDQIGNMAVSRAIGNAIDACVIKPIAALIACCRCCKPQPKKTKQIQESTTMAFDGLDIDTDKIRNEKAETARDPLPLRQNRHQYIASPPERQPSILLPTNGQPTAPSVIPACF